MIREMHFCAAIKQRRKRSNVHSDFILLGVIYQIFNILLALVKKPSLDFRPTYKLLIKEWSSNFRNLKVAWNCTAEHVGTLLEAGKNWQNKFFTYTIVYLK